MANTFNHNGKVVITDGGNVGIGTTGPTKKLVVIGASNDEWIATFTNSGTNPYGIYIDTSANSSGTYTFAAYTNAGTGFFVKNNGNVLIGTTTDAGYKLGINGSLSTTYANVYDPTSWSVVNIAASSVGVSASTHYSPYGTVSGTNPVFCTGQKFSEHGNYSIWRYNGSSHLATDFAINNSGAATFSSSVTASSLIKSGGTSSEYLMADGSVSTTATINNYTQTFYVPNTGGTAQWAKLGTWTAGQGGNVVTVQIDQHAGYNATTSQNQQVYIYMKTSNGSSVDANGFAGDSSFWTEGLNQNIEAGDVIWEANAAGVAATSYTLYVNLGAYTNASQYTVTTRGGTWTNVATLASPSGTTPSSTILLSENRFVVNNILTVGGAPSGNVLIGTYTDVGAKLNVAGGIRTNTLSWGDSDNAPLGSLSYGASSVTLETNAAYPIQLITNGTNAIFIGTNQNVLIGTTTDNGRKLQVQGDASVSGEIYSNQISQSRYIRYVFGGTNFAVGASTGIRWVIGRVYWNQIHWGSYSGMDIEIVNNYYNGARKKYTITNGAGGASLYLRSSQSYGSAYSRIVLGSAVDTGTTSGGYTNYYQDVYLEVNEYSQVSVIGELKGPQISIDKTSIGGGEYGWATLFSSPSASNISTFTTTQATILSSEGNWGYVDSSLGINTTSPSYNLDITAGLSDGTSNYIAIFESNKGASGNAYVGIGAYRSDALAAGRNAYINVVAPSGGAASLGLQIDGGNVGIGTPTPDAKLTIGADDSATNVGYIRLRGHDVYEANIYKTATYGIYMDTDTNARPIRIDGSAFITGITGNVLIGTTTDAGYKLDVNGTTRIQGNLITTGRQYVQSTPVNIKLPWFSLSANGTAVSDAQASDGTAAVRYSSSGNDTFFYGPYQAIDAGSYVARFRIKVASNASASYIGYIDVVGTNISGEAVSLRPNMFPTGGDYYYIDVPFNSNNDSSVFETRWIGWVGGITDTYLDHVLIVPQSRTNNVYVTDGDSYTIYEAQLPRLTILGGSGQTGIGNPSPYNYNGYQVLHVGRSGTVGLLKLATTSSNDGPEIFTSSTSDIVFNTNSSDTRVRIKGDTGNVLIGTGTDSGYKLDVNGNARVTDTLFVNTTLNKGKFNITGYDNGGINIIDQRTSSGSGVLYYSSITFRDYYDSVAAASINFYHNQYFGSGVNRLGFAFEGSERMTILRGGNVGIGTTSPTEKLELSGTGNVYARITATDASNAGVRFNASGVREYGIFSDGALRFYDFTAATERMRITSSGNVGIGTTAPDTPLSSARGIVINSGASNDVQIRMQNNTTGSAGSDGGLLSISGSQMYLWNYEASNLIFGTNNSERMRIDSSGNIGIGTTSISYRVDISGDARILSGSLGVGVAPNATDGRIDASNDIVAYSTSDQRLKENVTQIGNALEKVKTLTGVEFDWKEETAHVHGYHGHDVGVIAQDVQAVLPEAVRTNDSGYLSVRYEKMIALLIEANKELAARVEELEKKLK